MNYNEELELINNLDDYNLIKYLENGLISRSTGGDFAFYEFIRQEILKNDDFKRLLPDWIQTCRDTNQFWSFISKFGTYKERREFVWNEFTPIFEWIESKKHSPMDESIIFDEKYISDQWGKALDRKYNDPEGAITIARTLIESLLKYILDEQKIKHKENIDLSELYKEVAKLLNLAPEQHQEGIFKQILGGASGIISGLGTMRNKLSDSHGTIKKPKPKERHGELAVNLAGTMAIFIYKTYREKYPPSDQKTRSNL